MDLSELQARIAALKAEWDAVQPLKGEVYARWWLKLRLEWNYNSNHIEGNTLTYGETRQLILKDMATGTHALREYEEMKAHDVAIAHVKELAEDSRPLTEGDVRDLNRILLKEPFWKEAVTAEGQPTRKEIVPGRYKQLPNNVRTVTGELFAFSSPEETPAQMAELVEWFRTSLESDTPIIPLVAAFHHRFSLIHPFDDGNGRTMRLLVNYALMRRGYPPIVVRSADKAKYLGALSEADAGNLEKFAAFLAESLKEALELGLRASRGESLEEPEDWQKEMALLVRSYADESLLAPPWDEERVKRLAQNSWWPLAHLIVSKLQELKKVFFEVGTALVHPDGSTPGWEGISAVKNFTKLPESFGIQVYLRGFSHPTIRPFDHVTWLRFDLEEYRYSISSEYLPAPYTQLRYDTPLGDEKMEEIASAIARRIFEAVRVKCTENQIEQQRNAL